MSGFVAAKYNLDAFNCPHCNAYSHASWVPLHINTTRGMSQTEYNLAICSKCKKNSVWVQTGLDNEQEITGMMVYPDQVSIPPASFDMPNNVLKDYQEAASVLSRSPRSSAALLRQALQKLMVHLGEDGKNIDRNIRSLSEKEKLPAMIIKVADTMRLTGNDSVHPGEMLDEDRDFIANQMFGLLNLIVYNAITQPQEIENMYLMTPEKKRKAAEEKDAKAKQV